MVYGSLTRSDWYSLFLANRKWEKGIHCPLAGKGIVGIHCPHWQGKGMHSHNWQRVSPWYLRDHNSSVINSFSLFITVVIGIHMTSNVRSEWFLGSQYLGSKHGMIALGYPRFTYYSCSLQLTTIYKCLTYSEFCSLPTLAGDRDMGSTAHLAGIGKRYPLPTLAGKGYKMV